MKLIISILAGSMVAFSAFAKPAPKGTSNINKEGIRKVFSENQRAVRGCYERELAKNPNLEGVVKFDFDIANGGVVQNAKVKESSTLKNRAVQSCLLAKLKGWKFPEPPADKQVVNVVYPLAFAGK